MDLLARRVLARDRPAYEVANEAGPLLFPVWESARHAGDAYRLWACISDLQDDPFGPSSEPLCQIVGERASSDWVSLERSREVEDAYFQRWEPGSGAAWLAAVPRG
jgi:hypothetical protein